MNNESDEYLKKALQESLRSHTREQSKPLIDKENGWKVRGYGRCFITAALYQYCKNVECNDAELTNMGFYGEYNPKSTAVKAIEGYYDDFFKQNPASANNLREAPSVELMKAFLEKELDVGIKVDIYTDDNKYHATLGSDKTNSITVALLNKEEHVVLPETIEAMKQAGIKKKPNAQNLRNGLNVLQNQINERKPVVRQNIRDIRDVKRANSKSINNTQLNAQREVVYMQRREVAKQIEKDEAFARKMQAEEGRRTIMQRMPNKIKDAKVNQNVVKQKVFFNKRPQNLHHELNALHNRNAAPQNNGRLAVQSSVFPNKVVSQIRPQETLPAINDRQGKALQAYAKQPNPKPVSKNHGIIKF